MKTDTLEMRVHGKTQSEILRAARGVALAYFEHPNFRLETSRAEASLFVSGDVSHFTADVTAIAFDEPKE